MNRKKRKETIKAAKGLNHQKNYLLANHGEENRDSSQVTPLQDGEEIESIGFNYEYTNKRVCHIQNQSINISRQWQNQLAQACQTQSNKPNDVEDFINLDDDQGYDQQSPEINNRQYTLMNQMTVAEKRPNKKCGSIKNRLNQRNQNFINSSILYEDVIDAQLGKEFYFEQYQIEVKKEIELPCGQRKVEAIIQALLSDFSEYQKKIACLLEIEQQIILLVVKHIIYKFLISKLQQTYLQYLDEELIYFFNSLNSKDIVMSQARDYILFKQQFQLSNITQQQISKDIKSQLSIDGQFSKSICTRYSKYIKQTKKDFKYEDNKKVGKKLLKILIQNDKENIKQFIASHYYSNLIQNKQSIKYPCIYLDDNFNLLIQYDHLGSSK
ncbi:hypothetical protein pb186bvf_002721 [Paramecium bursaria]